MTTITTNSKVPTDQTPSALRQFAQWSQTCLLEFRARRAQNASLHRLKDRDLRDIGITEHDIYAANNLPLSADAALALDRIRPIRSGNW